MKALRLQMAIYELLRLRKDQRGQDLTEYALMLCMVAIVAYGWLPQSYGGALSNIWAKVRSVMFVLTGTA